MRWLEATQAYCDAATAGPWLGPFGPAARGWVVRDDSRYPVHIAEFFVLADAEFCLNARTDLPRALAELAATQTLFRNGLAITTEQLERADAAEAKLREVRAYIEGALQDSRVETTTSNLHKALKVLDG